MRVEVWEEHPLSWCLVTLCMEYHPPGQSPVSYTCPTYHGGGGRVGESLEY